MWGGHVVIVEVQHLFIVTLYDVDKIQASCFPVQANMVIWDISIVGSQTQTDQGSE